MASLPTASRHARRGESGLREWSGSVRLCQIRTLLALIPHDSLPVELERSKHDTQHVILPADPKLQTET